MAGFIFHGPIKAVAGSCPFDHTWNLWSWDHGHCSCIWAISKPHSQIQDFLLLGYCGLKWLDQWHRKIQFLYCKFLLTKSLNIESSVTWSSDGQFIWDPYWTMCFQIAGDKAAVMGNAYQHLRKTWFLGSYSEFAQRSTVAILHESEVSAHGSWLSYCSCPHTIQALNTDLSGLDYNDSENSVSHRCSVIPIFGDRVLKHREAIYWTYFPQTGYCPH